MSKPYSYGGQAVIEGVMMRGRNGWAVAVRHPSGRIIVREQPLTSVVYRSRWGRWPFIRGVLALWETLSLGMRSLIFSANVAVAAEAAAQKAPRDGQTPDGTAGSPAAIEQEAGELPQRVMWGSVLLAFPFAIGVFFVLPVLAAGLIDRLLVGLPYEKVLSNLVEGVIRIGLLVGYMAAISLVPDVRRVFEYHGAEHKTIHAWEQGAPLTPESVLRFSRIHPRCGTTFVLVVMVLYVLIFSLLGKPPLLERIVSRVVLIPVLAALGYELIRWAARHYRNSLVRAIMAPGLSLQFLTTREPDTAQVEVAITALERVLVADGALPAAASQTSGSALLQQPAGTGA
jgi:uncharacterized protein YqhQ